jgi:hypothetical protein
MQNFYEWLSNVALIDRLRLIETYYSFDPAQYNQVFRDELEKVIQRSSDPVQQQSLGHLQDFDWLSYIAGSVRRIYRDYRQGQEAISDVASKLLLGSLFNGFTVPPSTGTDAEDAGNYLLARFKTSVAHAIQNMVEKEANRRRYLRTVAIQQEFEPGAITVDDLPARPLPARDEDDMIEGFRGLLKNRLGDLGLAVFDLRMAGGETKSLAGSPSVGSPGKYVIKRVVQEIKALAREYAQRLGDPAFIRDIERAMGREGATVAKRLATARQAR